MINNHGRLGRLLIPEPNASEQARAVNLNEANRVTGLIENVLEIHTTGFSATTFPDP